MRGGGRCRGILGGQQGRVLLWKGLIQWGLRLPRASLGKAQLQESRGGGGDLHSVHWSSCRRSGLKRLPGVLWAPCFARGRNRQALAGIFGGSFAKKIYQCWRGRQIRRQWGCRMDPVHFTGRAGGRKLLAGVGPSRALRGPLQGCHQVPRLLLSKRAPGSSAASGPGFGAEPASASLSLVLR